ncbi:MAG: cystathionine gamma-synthase [Planctomycetaceae bacterium]|nr:cystathionine gamma-synthase [Planctomycetaceae bacterium]
MSDLLTNPLCKPEHLGRSIPDSPHAVSACLPTWQDCIGYEEQEPRVVSKLTAGYPRFVYNSLCRDLFDRCAERFANAGQTCLAFASQQAAERCSDYLHDFAETDAVSVHPLNQHGVYAVAFPSEHAKAAKNFWQHSGLGVTSRQAAACLSSGTIPDGDAARQTIRSRVADVVGVDPENVLLYSCGMSAIDALHQVLCKMFPQRKSVQFGFPYVDTLKIQQQFGTGAIFHPKGEATNLDALEEQLADERVSAIFTEFPSNPLLASPDLVRLREIADRHEVPLVVDDTVASCANVDLSEVADVVCMSLTKYFSGVGDVAGGALVISPGSGFRTQLFEGLREQEGGLWCEDAIVLERNSADFTTRVQRINKTAARVVDALGKHALVEEVYYPTRRSKELYDRFKRPEGGYGGLFSLLLKNAATTTSRFFDALRVCKGPNLGTNYTLACPYTILAHYEELDFVESCGVSRHLIRVSVGLEPADELIARFEAALACLAVR